MAQPKTPGISNSSRLLVFMGVSGSGKTLIGNRVAQALNLPFLEADSFHSAGNRAKMAAGVPLEDEDRIDWLDAIADAARGELKKGGSAVLACSALKESYRRRLANGVDATCHWFLLHGPEDLIRQRMEARRGHYMPAALLQSQLETLEVPENAQFLDIQLSPDRLVHDAVTAIRALPGADKGVSAQP